jgi:hypothetical protein
MGRTRTQPTARQRRAPRWVVGSTKNPKLGRFSPLESGHRDEESTQGGLYLKPVSDARHVLHQGSCVAVAVRSAAADPFVVTAPNAGRGTLSRPGVSLPILAPATALHRWVPVPLTRCSCERHARQSAMSPPNGARRSLAASSRLRRCCRARRCCGKTDHPLRRVCGGASSLPASASRSKAWRLSCGIPSAALRTRCMARSMPVSQVLWINRMIESSSARGWRNCRRTLERTGGGSAR